MTPVERHRVVIIGSGPTGLTLANLLGDAGIDVLLVERNAQTVQEPRAVSIDDESLRTMQAAGLAETVLTKVVPGYGSHYYSPRGIRFAIVEPAGTPFGYPRRNAFRQPVLEGQLRAGLERFPSVRAAFGWRMTSYTASADGVSVEIAGPDGALRQVEAEYLVGCDGAASPVREALGIALEGTTFDERWLIVDLENNENTLRHTKVFCDGRRPCITLPGPDRTRRFEFKLLPGETDEALLAPAMIERLLATHGGDPNATLRRKVVYRFHARVAPRWSAGRVFLAGDAVHLTPPFAGQGMNSGIRDAHNLTWKLAAVLDGRLGTGLLDTYQPERSGHVWQMIRMALRMGRVMSPKTYWHGFFTQLALLSLNIWPPARDYVTQMKYKPKPRFETGFMVPDGKSVRRTLMGRMFPQPKVRTADGGEVLLDRVLGNRFVLLAYTTQPEQAFASLTQPVWDALQAAKVAVLPPGSALSAAPPGVTVVAATDGAFAAALADYGETILLLRPDHYAAAALPAGDAAAVGRVEDLVERSWKNGRPDDAAKLRRLRRRPQPAAASLV